MTPGAFACAAAGRQLTAAILVSQAALSRASGAGNGKGLRTPALRFVGAQSAVES